jgi:hypothetical protein
MREPRLLAIALVASSLLWFGSAAAAPFLTGAWQLVRVTIPSAENSLPRGMLNVKEIYGEDGRICFVAPSGVLDNTSPCHSYSVEGSVRTIRISGRGPIRAQIAFPDEDTLVVKQSSGDVWTYRRLAPSESVNTRLEPRSVEELVGGDGADVSYESADSGNLPAAHRIVGTWEEIAQCGVSPSEAPPYGFLNNVWNFSQSSLLRTIRRGKLSDRVAPVPYEITGGILKIGQASRLPFAFNEWGHLVLGEGERKIVLKLVNRNSTAEATIPRLKIVLLSLRGEKCDL